MTDEAPDAERHLPDDRSLVAVAGRLAPLLNDDLGETLVGIASYEDGEYDVAYRDDAASARYTDSDVRAIVTNMDAIGAPAYEDHHGEPLRGTVRVYDKLVTVAVPVAETAGIVVVLRNDGSHDPHSVIESVETGMS